MNNENEMSTSPHGTSTPNRQAQVVGSLERPSRRNFLKMLAVGGGVFAMGGILGGTLGSIKVLGASEPLSTTNKWLSGFRLVEDKKEVRVFDKKGDEILVIDKNF